MLLKPIQHGSTALGGAQTAKVSVTLHHMSVLVKDIDLGQIMCLTHSKIVGVMRRRYLNKARAIPGIDMPIRKNRNFSINNG